MANSRFIKRSKTRLDAHRVSSWPPRRSTSARMCPRYLTALRIGLRKCQAQNDRFEIEGNQKGDSRHKNTHKSGGCQTFNPRRSRIKKPMGQCCYGVPYRIHPKNKWDTLFSLLKVVKTLSRFKENAIYSHVSEPSFWGDLITPTASDCFEKHTIILVTPFQPRGISQATPSHDSPS